MQLKHAVSVTKTLFTNGLKNERLTWEYLWGIQWGELGKVGISDTDKKDKYNMKKFDDVEYDADGLVPLADFKRAGSRLYHLMDEPVLISVNIRNLKYFNEVYGYTCGDELLVKMIRYFCVDDDDCWLAAKYYVDHLIILTEGYGVPERFLKARLQMAIQNFMKMINEEYPMSKVHISCGAYIMRQNDTFQYAIDNARYAMKSITHKYVDVIAVYSDELRNRSLKEASVIPSFENALENNKIRLFLQPKFSIDEQKVVGAEALSRIEDEHGNVISPNVYVPVLESAELITQLDFQMILLVLEQMKQWKEDYGELLEVSVNLSRADFMVPGFLQKVDQLVESYQIPKKYLEFEITETMFCEDLQRIIQKVTWLRMKGYRISMDDFGTGYNSLYILGRIPTNVVKFDRAFVVNSLQNCQGIEIMRSLVEMFRRINLDVICEGVETREEEKIVQECGCNMIQGYLYDKPISVREFERKYIQRVRKKCSCV